ncbi:CheR family methyltransferase [Mucilaginibacter sp. OK098]|uniref:CheR family methyltransferase n=1 Tax=Mucilaginibacter sp. OK098 TaxID=1855297 RepID=UPI00091EFAF7|nr:CheR family methyltransferase [Mucilaginibacter sp. OK098]SHN36846.1 two-component system, chemotaxis family, CheB/CheR fusion protein [Mucilaginibacter sp. OK098]
MSLHGSVFPDNVNLEKQFPVVGIGASAGGIEAFKLFLKSIPEKSGMAYVFVQHLHPEYDSYLPEIFQKSTKIPISLIENNIHLEPDHIYVIPPGNILTATDGVLKLDPLKNKKVKTIDVFFSSLAVVHQSFAVGVVLSGALNDGTLGLQVIKSHGGLTFAQSEDSAIFDSMPKSAIRSGAVDFVLPAGQIIEKLISINRPFRTNYTQSEIKQNEPEQDEEVFRQLLTVLRIRRGVDFTNYKQSTIKRRMVRRMALNKFEEPKEYLTFLRENKGEQDALYNDMLISVTDFFRDPKSFELLCTSIFPVLLLHKTATEPLRIWVAGCATGEEAYSMAICLQEYLGDKVSARKIQIFATDVSEQAISRARTGIYRQTELDGLSSFQVQQFFNKVDGSYQVNKSIRDMCVFAHHNLLKDPPFSKIDLVSCRNVMIYLEPVLQKRALNTFHYALNERGYLLMGKSETIGSSTDLFLPVDKNQKIYQSKGPHGKFRNVTSERSEQTLKDIDQVNADNGGERDINKIADALLLSKYTPAGVMVNQAFDIIQFRGKTDAWLAVSPGKPSFNVLKMAREGLSFEIRNLLHMAKTRQDAVRKEGISFKVDGGQQQYVNIEVVQLSDNEEAYYLILFQNSILSGTSFLAENGASSLHPQENVNAWVQRIDQLEKELSQTREDMRAITEVQEAANEELQSANEELLSGSEELRSLNEELETSTEELQSTNEEITIVNNELLDRNDQLNNSRRYTEEIFNTIHDPLVILDKELIVLRATDGFYNMFRVNEEDTEGKFVYDLGNKQWNIPALRHQLEDILPEQGFFKAFEVDHVFKTIGRRIMQLTARQFDTYTHEKLTLLAIHDITDKRKVEEGLAEAERLLAESKERLHFAIESAGIGAWDYNLQTKELIWDNRNKELFGLEPADAVDFDTFLKLIHSDDRDATNDAINKALSGVNGGEFNFEYRTIGKNNQKLRWIKSKGKAYFDKDKKPTRFIGTVLDVSIEKELEQTTLGLLRKKDEFISIASHELKTPITTLRASLQLLDRMKNNPSPMLPKFLDQASRSVERITRLIDELLNVNSMKEGQLRLNKHSFPIADMLKECCGHVRAIGKYELIVQGDETLLVNADEDRVDQVVVNLVNNAVKYAPEGKNIYLIIEKEGNAVKISVKDSGPGIPKDKIPHLFDRYYRADYNGGQYSGMGLGLYICSEIIKRHDGTIGVDSKIGEGATFWFTLPL